MRSIGVSSVCGLVVYGVHVALRCTPCGVCLYTFGWLVGWLVGWLCFQSGRFLTFDAATPTHGQSRAIRQSRTVQLCTAGDDVRGLRSEFEVM